MATPSFIHAGTLVFAGLVLAASVHVTAEESPRSAAPAGEKTIPAAGAEKRPAATPPDVIVPDQRSGGRVPEPRPRDKGRTIRCWQYGRLILEEPVVGGPRPEGQAYDFKRPGDAKGLQLIDLRSGGVCLIGPAGQ